MVVRGVIVLVVALVSGSLAQSQDASLDQQARDLFNAGQTAFEAGRFEHARDYFRQAHQLSQRPQLLYNVAQAEDRLQNEDAALDAFEAYLEALPDADNRGAVRARIDALRTAIERRDAAREGDGDAPRLRWTWLTGATALVTGALAITMWVVANNEYDSLESGCLVMDGGCTQDEVAQSSVEEFVLATNVMLAVSLIATVATAIALPIELTRSPSNATNASLRIGPGTLALRGTW